MVASGAEDRVHERPRRQRRHLGDQPGWQRVAAADGQSGTRFRACLVSRRYDDRLHQYAQRPRPVRDGFKRRQSAAVAEREQRLPTRLAAPRGRLRAGHGHEAACPGQRPGWFHLYVGTTVVAAAVGDGGSGTRQVAPGFYDVSDDPVFSSGAISSQYDTFTMCFRNGSAFVPPAEGIDVAAGDHVICTISNTRIYIFLLGLT